LAAGCFNAWSRLTQDGHTAEGIPSYCSDEFDQGNARSFCGAGVSGGGGSEVIALEILF